MGRVSWIDDKDRRHLERPYVQNSCSCYTFCQSRKSAQNLNLRLRGKESIVVVHCVLLIMGGAHQGIKFNVCSFFFLIYMATKVDWAWCLFSVTENCSKYSVLEVMKRLQKHKKPSLVRLSKKRITFYIKYSTLVADLISLIVVIFYDNGEHCSQNKMNDLWSLLFFRQF